MFAAKSHLITLAAAAVAVVGFAMGASAHAAPARATGASAGAGGKCTVTVGPNKGKTGTYTTEEGTGATWCEGSWGGTECTGGRCKDAALVAGTTPVRPTKSYNFLSR